MMKIFNGFTQELVDMINAGAIGVIPTDTIYGLVGSLTNEEAILKIYKIKQRPINKRVGTILISGPKQIINFTESEQLSLASKFWPGTSVELNILSGLHHAHKGNGTLAFRVPDKKALLDLISKTGPLASTSANFAGEEPITDVDQAINLFGDKLDFYVDGGDLSGRKPSKIVKILSSGKIEVIR